MVWLRKASPAVHARLLREGGTPRGDQPASPIWRRLDRLIEVMLHGITSAERRGLGVSGPRGLELSAREAAHFVSGCRDGAMDASIGALLAATKLKRFKGFNARKKAEAQEAWILGRDV